MRFDGDPTPVRKSARRDEGRCTGEVGADSPPALSLVGWEDEAASVVISKPPSPLPEEAPTAPPRGEVIMVCARRTGLREGPSAMGDTGAPASLLLVTFPPLTTTAMGAGPPALRPLVMAEACDTLAFRMRICIAFFCLRACLRNSRSLRFGSSMSAAEAAAEDALAESTPPSWLVDELDANPGL